MDVSPRVRGRALEPLKLPRDAVDDDVLHRPPSGDGSYVGLRYHLVTAATLARVNEAAESTE